MDDPVTEYALRVLDGKLPAGPLVIHACERHMHDLQRDDLFLDLGEVHRWVRFFSMLRQFKDKFYGKPLVLAPWQVFRVGSVMGWKWRESGLRRYQVSFNKVPRKNGKTTEMAGIGLGGLLIDRVRGAEVYSLATKSDQARIVFNAGKSMIGLSKGLQKRLRDTKNVILYAKYGSVWKPLNKESKGLDGLNPSLGLYDEFAQWRDVELRGKIEQGFGSRSEPLEWIITTEGKQLESPCCELTDHAKNVLCPEQPDYVDDGLFAYLATPFDDDDPGAPSTWERCNPNLGVGKSFKSIQDLWSRAQHLKSALHDFKTYQLNILVGESSGFIDMERWQLAQDQNLRLDAFKGLSHAEAKTIKCYQGLDLAETTDLSALVHLFVCPDDIWRVFVDFWCPEEHIELRANTDKVPYRRWQEDGFLRSTPGNATDFDFIEADICRMAESLNVAELLYDRYKSQYVVQNLTKEKVVLCVPYGQGYKDASPALKEIERRLLNGKIKFAYNPVMTWCASNLKVDIDPAGNVKPNKKKANLRIDGMSALMNAVGGAMLPRKKKGPPEDGWEVRSV